MELLKYQVACKSCMSAEGSTQMISVEENYNFYENTIFKTEYQLSRYIKELLEKSDFPCRICNSNNLDISDIRYKDKKVLISSEIDHFKLEINHNGVNVSVNTSGSKHLPNDFMPQALKLMLNAIRIIPSYEFEEQKKGRINFYVSSGYIGMSNERTMRLEQFSFVGFEKESVIELIKDVMKHMIENN